LRDPHRSVAVAHLRTTAGDGGSHDDNARTVHPGGSSAGTPGTRVLVLDGHRIFAEALVDTLMRVPGIEVIGLATTLDDAVRVLGGSTLDVLVVDPSTIGRVSWPALQSVARGAPIALVTGESALQGTVALHGVRGWFGKHEEISALAEAIPGLALGHAYFPPARLGAEFDELISSLADFETGIGAFASLTPREREVMACLLEGMDRSAVSAHLHLSQRTVGAHIEHLLLKLDVHSTLSAVALARRFGWDRLLQRP
jgi:DNA-binding NarL/FixJ family response regulator